MSVAFNASRAAGIMADSGMGDNAIISTLRELEPCARFDGAPFYTLAKINAAIRARACSRISPGQLAYEADVKARPLYHDGTPRKPWQDLGAPERSTWERNPTPRFH